jgi:CelD/BcsL family acetyltransferase involved in cellulose biosynthesis
MTTTTTLVQAAGTARRRGVLDVELLEGMGAFEALRPEWDALLGRGPVDQPFQRHAWIRAWLRAFAPSAPLRLVVARDATGAPIGIAPLLERRRGGLVVLEAPANDHSSRVEWILGEDPRAAVDALWGCIRDRLSWDLLVLRDVPVEGPTSTWLDRAARADRHLVGRWRSLDTPYLTLGGAARGSGPSTKFLANLRRRMRRLGEQGAVSYRRVDGGGEVGPFLDRFLALEAAGWKGREGTAIAHDRRAAAFYRMVAEAAAREGWLALRSLDLDGRPVAMHLGLLHRGVYALPKPAYDESLAPCSPGQLLLREVLAECEARGLGELDFLGPDMPWKRDWAPAIRPHDWLHVYRPGPTGAALHAVKHRLKPLAKEVLSWWRR